MTDTRKEFEEWFEGQYGKKPMPSPKNGDEPHTNTYMTMFADGADKGWKACQSLNDKRIQQLMAVIELKDTALANAIVADRFCAETNISDEHRQAKADAHHEAILSVEAALAIKPEDVELVEVGEADFDKPTGTVNLDIYNIDFDGMHKLYTIKTKE